MKTRKEISEQIQEDIRTYLWDKLNKSNSPDYVGPCAVSDLCQIVVDNFDTNKNEPKSWWEIMEDDKNRCQSLADIHEDIEKYFVQLNDIGHDLGYTELGREVKTDDEIKEDVLNIIDERLEDEPTLLEKLGEDKYEKLRQMAMDDQANDSDDIQEKDNI